MGFNFSGQPEYALNTSLAEEMIRLYGVLTKFVLVSQINQDLHVFGDFSHLKTNGNSVYEIYALPENTEDWDSNGYSLTSFGLVNYEVINLFVAKSSLDNIAIPGNITGNLIVFPNNKVMEITAADFVVPGVNNLFTYKDEKSVFKLTCKPHDFKLINEVDTVDISVSSGTAYETLDVYFNELIDSTQDQNEEAEVIPQVQTVNDNTEINTKVMKPIVDKTEKSVWGDFE